MFTYFIELFEDRKEIAQEKKAKYENRLSDVRAGKADPMDAMPTDIFTLEHEIACLDEGIQNYERAIAEAKHYKSAIDTLIKQ